MFSTSCIFGCDLPSAETAHFYKALISFLIGSPSGKRDLLLFTIRDHDLIDELAAVIGINSQYGKREERACALESSQHRLPASMDERQAFRPSGRDIGERQRVQVATFDFGTTVGDQIRLQKARAVLIPLLESADRDLLLEQGAGSRCGEAALTTFALGTRGADPLLLRS